MLDNIKDHFSAFFFFFQAVDHSHSFMSAIPVGMQGSNKVTPLLCVLGQLPACPPGVMEGLQLPFYSSTPGVSGSPSFPLSLWCPVKHWLSSHHMSHPSPPPLHDDGAHAILVAAGEKILLGDGLRQEYSQDSLRFLVWKVDKLSKSLSVILQHSEPYGGVETTQLWHSLSLVLVLYSDKGPGRIFLDSADFRLI